MKNDCRLILVEGLCGTGKSTLAERLQRHLARQGVAASFYDEGAAGHPVSLNGHAFFREAEYEALLERYPKAANEIRSRAIKEDGRYLVPYREVRAFREADALYAKLKSRELCWTAEPVAAFEEFTSLIQRQWARFAELAGASERVYVLEAVFLQHQIHDLLRLYDADDRRIGQHVRGISEAIAALRPVLFYLTQPSVREQQVWISAIRSKPHVAEEPNIRFMENRKRIELGLLAHLPFPAHVIDNPSLDWEDVFGRMTAAIAGKQMA